MLLWDAGPGEIRTGLIEDDVLTEFRLIRLRRDHALQQAGERYTVRLIERIGSGQARVDIGSGTLAMLQPCPDLPLGSLIEAEMVRGPIAEPGQWKLAKLKPLVETPPTQPAPAWHFSAEPWELFLRANAPLVKTLICPDARSANEVEAVLGAHTPTIMINPHTISDAGFDALIDSAVSGDFPIDGGMIKIERTRAMTMIDVDGTAPARALNLAAANEIPRLLRLFNIGGPIGIDFVSSSAREERLQVAAAFDAAAGSLGPFERTAINGFGFCQVVRPRLGASILETLCGTRIGAMSTESQAIALLRAAGRSIGAGARHLVARPAIIDAIKSWPEEIGALRADLGVVIELVPDASAIGYGHVHVTQS
jgi:ribonuclease G